MEMHRFISGDLTVEASDNTLKELVEFIRRAEDAGVEPSGFISDLAYSIEYELGLGETIDDLKARLYENKETLEFTIVSVRGALCDNAFPGNEYQKYKNYKGCNVKLVNYGCNKDEAKVVRRPTYEELGLIFDNFDDTVQDCIVQIEKVNYDE